MTAAIRGIHAVHAGPAAAAGTGPGPRGALRIGAAARAVGVSQSALRLWERQGLVSPARSPGGYRLYRPADVDQLRRIRRMRTERVNAPGIRRILNGTTRPGAAERASQHGARLRALRTERHLSLREASRRAGVSVSFLSALERDLAGASVTTVQRLTHAYGVTVQDLLRPAGASDRRVPAGEGAVLEMEQAGVRIEQLAVGAKRLEPQLFVLAPASSSDGAYRHEGEEFLYVLEGSLTVWVGAEQPYRLATGDSLTFPSTQPHRWRNRADGETRLLWINTPPTF